MAKQIGDQDILKAIKLANLWWNKNSIDGYYKDYDQMPRRFSLKGFLEVLEDKKLKRSLILMGPRRVGKTVLMHHSIIHLLKESKISPQKILYISIDNPIFYGQSLFHLLMIFVEHFGHKIDRTTKPDHLYIFFDEIQYLKDWEQHLKSLHDLFPNIKFVASGSASAALNRKSKESGAGRFRDFILNPPSFEEFLYFLGEKDKDVVQIIKDFNNFREKSLKIVEEKVNKLNKESKEKIKISETNKFFVDSYHIYKEFFVKYGTQLNHHFVDYINYGGFPEVTLSDSPNSLIEKIRSDIIEKVLLRDLPSVYGIADSMELNSFFSHIVFNCGKEFSIETLSKESGIAKNTVKKYLEYLEAAFLIRKLSKIDQNAKMFKRETVFKLYLVNPSLRTVFFGDIDEKSPIAGNMVENIILNQLIYGGDNIRGIHYIYNLYYARWQSGEIDFVLLNDGTLKPQMALEVKFSDNINLETKQLATFTKNHNLKFIIATSKTKLDIKITEKNISFLIPNSLFCFFYRGEGKPFFYYL